MNWLLGFNDEEVCIVFACVQGEADTDKVGVANMPAGVFAMVATVWGQPFPIRFGQRRVVYAAVAASWDPFLLQVSVATARLSGCHGDMWSGVRSLAQMLIHVHSGSRGARSSLFPSSCDPVSTG